MNSSFSIILILIGFFAIFIFSIFFLKSFIEKIVEPKLSLIEIRDFTILNNSIYVEHKKLSKKEFEKYNGTEIEKNLLKISYLRNSYFELITFSQDKKLFELNWIKKTNCIGLNFMVEILIGENLKNIVGTKYIAEKNAQKLSEIQTEYEMKKVLINNNCTACGEKVGRENLICGNCGINLSL
jgi:hypothetical protein